MSNTSQPKIAVCFITLNRESLTKATIENAKAKAGIDFDFFALDQGSTDGVFNLIEPNVTYYVKKKENIGVASGFNFLWNMAKHMDYDFICNIGNDIDLPQNWLKEFYKTYVAIDKEHQYLAIHSVEALPSQKITVNNKQYIPSDTIFGCTFFNISLLDYVGYFNTAYNPYGLEDSEYTYRCHKSGVICGYLDIGTAHHTGSPYGQDDNGEYRRMKDESLKKNAVIYGEEIENMNRLNNYYKPYV